MEAGDLRIPDLPLDSCEVFFAIMFTEKKTKEAILVTLSCPLPIRTHGVRNLNVSRYASVRVAFLYGVERTMMCQREVLRKR